MTTTPCKSCGAPLIWAKTAKGKRIPLDAEPRADGTLALRDGTAVTVGPAPFCGYDDTRYICHFGTCPNAAQHRRK